MPVISARTARSFRALISEDIAGLRALFAVRNLSEDFYRSREADGRRPVRGKRREEKGR